MKIEHEASTIPQCPIAPSQKVISGKWTLIILYFLSQRTFRFGELQRKLPNVTQASLTKQLRLLEKYQVVHREVYKQVPPKVEYSLTDLGQKFVPVLQDLEKWTVEFQKVNVEEEK